MFEFFKIPVSPLSSLSPLSFPLPPLSLCADT